MALLRTALLGGVQTGMARRAGIETHRRKSKAESCGRNFRPIVPKENHSIERV
jgi:hypothetical protein